MGTRDDLLAEADALEREADALDVAIAELERLGRDVTIFRAKERERRRACERIRAIAAPLPADVERPVPDGLRSAPERGTVQEMNAVERRELGLAKSKGQQRARGEVDPLTAAANAKGFSLRAFAKKIGESPSALANYRRGLYRIPRSTADRIERELGFAATPENWPAGIK